MVEIRPACAADIPALVGLARAMHAESPYFSRFEFLPKKVESLLERLVPGLTGGALVADKDGMIVGMAAGFVFEHFFSNVKTASDFAIYVAPESRGSTVGLKLIRALEQKMRQLGAVDITLGVSTEVNADRTADLYARIGYRRKGYSMIKELH